MIGERLFAGCWDFPLHQHKAIKRRLHRVCMRDCSADALVALDELFASFDLTELVHFLREWTFAHSQIERSLRLEAIRLQGDEQVFTICIGLEAQLGHLEDAERAAFKAVIGAFRRAFLIVSGGHDLIARARGSFAALKITPPDLSATLLDGETAAVLRTLERAARRQPAPIGSDLAAQIRTLRRDGLAGSLEAVLSYWIERRIEPAIAARVRALTQVDQGCDHWLVLPQLFTMPGRMAKQLSYSMCRLGAAFEQGECDLAAAVLWRQLWRYLYTAMYTLDGREIGATVVRNWWIIQKTIAEIRAEVVTSDRNRPRLAEDADGDGDAADVVVDEPYASVADQIGSIYDPADIPRLAVEVVRRRGKAINIKDAATIVDYIRTFASQIGLEHEELLPSPPPDWEGDDRIREQRALLERCITEPGVLTASERAAIKRKVFLAGQSMTRRKYRSIFEVDKQRDDAVIRLVMTKDKATGERIERVAGRALSKLRDCIARHRDGGCTTGGTDERH